MRGISASESVTAHAPLYAKEIDEDDREDDEQHHRRDGRAHGRTARLELVAEEGAVKIRPQNIGAEVRSRDGALDGEDQIEGVEIRDERKDGDNPERGND